MLWGSRPAVTLYPLRKGPPSRSARARPLTSFPFLHFRSGAVLIPTSAPASGKGFASPPNATFLLYSNYTNGDAAFDSFFFLFDLLECSSRLPASELGMIVDKGCDFPQTIDAALRKYGESMWFFREQPCRTTARALNSYIGDHKKWVSKVL